MRTAGRNGIVILLGLTAALLPACAMAQTAVSQGEAVEVPVIEKPAPPLPKGPEAESLPPDVRPQPGEPGPGAEEEPAPAVPAAVQMRRTEALNFLIRDGLLPPETLTRATPVTRAELARLMVHAIGYDTSVVSEFPFYRDVPRDFPEYGAVEVAREKRLIDYPDDHGFYHPGEAVHFTDLYAAMGKALTAPAPSASANELIVESFADGNQLPMDLTTAVAKMTNAHFFPQTNEERRQTYLMPHRRVTPLEIAPFIVRLMQVAGTHIQLEAASPIGEVAVLPAGLGMTITPTASLFRSRLAVGDTVNFSLVNDAGPLGKGSRFRGRVESVADGNTYHIRLYEVRTVNEDQFFNTNATLTIVFPEKDEKAFVVPGQVFEIRSELPLTLQTGPASRPSEPEPPENSPPTPEAEPG